MKTKYTAPYGLLALCDVDGVGFEWVKARWEDDPVGAQLDLAREVAHGNAGPEDQLAILGWLMRYGDPSAQEVASEHIGVLMPGWLRWSWTCALQDGVEWAFARRSDAVGEEIRTAWLRLWARHLCSGTTAVVSVLPPSETHPDRHLLLDFKGLAKVWLFVAGKHGLLSAKMSSETVRLPAPRGVWSQAGERNSWWVLEEVTGWIAEIELVQREVSRGLALDAPGELGEGVAA